MRRALSAVLCAVAFFAAGCHSNNDASGYANAWVTLTDEPGDFTSYIVTIDSITLTRNDGAVVTALATPEIVDFTKLSDISELWGTATVPTGIYLQANIVLDYTTADLSVMIYGQPVSAVAVNSAGVALTTVSINVILDPANPLNLAPTYATTAAGRLALDFNLAASTSSVNTSVSPPTVTVKPFFTVGNAAADTKLIRIRGPLINSSVSQNTFTVYVRPFFDEVDNLGSLTMFADANTIYSNNGIVTVGSPGISQLSQSSAGTTVTASYNTFEPTATPTAIAGIFHPKYVIAGSTLEDVYTQGIEGDVVARNGNTLTLRGSTTQFNDGTSTFNVADAQVILGPSTKVTADDDATATGLTYLSVAVGQHIIARGIYELPNNVVTVDATGASATNTGSVRLISTNLWGSLVSSVPGSLVLNLSTINNWPVTNYTFTGDGATAASNPVPAAYAVDTGVLTVPAIPAGDPVWISGLVTPFGSAPPDFGATSVSAEASVSASLEVHWTGDGTPAPFSSLTATGATIDLASALFGTGVIRIGPESVDLKSLPASPQIISTPQSPSTPANAGVPGSVPVTLPPVFQPAYAFGNPATVAPGGIYQYSDFATFGTALAKALPGSPALQLQATGLFNRAANTFTATSISIALN